MSTSFHCLTAIASLITIMQCTDEIACDDPEMCIGQSLTATNINANGYKSVVGSNSSMNCTNRCRCGGSFGCHSISFIQSSNAVRCDGDNACSHAGFIQAANELDCEGVSACAFTVIRKGNVVHCDGDKACSHANISGATHIFAKGSYSLLNATIDSRGIDGSLLLLRLHSYHAGFGASLICRANHTCDIQCNLNACSHFHVHCIGNCTFQTLEDQGILPKGSIMPIHNLSLFDATALELRYDSQQIVIANDMLCNSETSLTFDYYQEMDNETVLLVNTSLCCRGTESCHNINGDTVLIEVESTFTVPYKMICSGKSACWETMIDNYLGNVYCSAEMSCHQAYINTTQYVYCLAAESCQQSHIYNALHVICGSHYSCQAAKIQTSGLGQTHYLSFMSLRAARDARIHCRRNDECVIFCGASNSCLNIVVQCDFGCTVTIECEDPFGLGRCGVVVTHHPTISPTAIPTMGPIIPITTDMMNDGEMNAISNDGIVFGMVLVGCVTIIPAMLIMLAFSFHRKRKGSDRPHYLSLFRFFCGVADWFSDAFWAYSLCISGHYLWISAFIFVFGSHFVSFMICVYWVAKWRQNSDRIHIAEYANKYDKVVIALSLVSTFYGATALITSHLFHLQVLSLWLEDTHLKSISTMKILNEAFLENIPVLIIQILYLKSTHDSNLNFITLLAMVFTVTSVLVCLGTLVERVIHYAMGHRIKLKEGLNEIVMEFILQSAEKDTIKRYHTHTHYLMTDAICTALEIEKTQVKIQRIQKVSQGIKTNVNLILLQDNAALEIFNGLQPNEEEDGTEHDPVLLDNLLNECMDRLAIHLGSVTLNIVHIEFKKRTSDHKNTDQQRMLQPIEMVQQDWNTIGDGGYE
eukprot:199673_1